MSADRPRPLRWAAYTAVLYAGFVHNLFCAPDGFLTSCDEFRTAHLSGDCCLVVNRLRAAEAGAPPLAPMSFWDPDRKADDWYPAQFGLPAVALSAVQRATGWAAWDVAVVGSAAAGLLAAAAVGLFFADVAARVGPLAGHTGVTLAACSTPFLSFAPAVYWGLAAMLAPFVAAWVLLPWADGSGRRAAVALAAVGLLVGVRCLCGYEYLSTVAAAPAAAAAYHVARTGGGIRRWAGWAAGLAAAGVAGFALTAAMHCWQIDRELGLDGPAVIRGRAVNRTVAAVDPAELAYPLYCPDLPALPPSVRVPARCFLNYFWLPAAGSPQTWGRARFEVPLGLVTLAAVALGTGFWLARRRLPPAVAALGPAALVGFLASATWQVLAVNHMCVHGHLNLVVYAVPFLLVAFALVGAGLQLVADRRGWRRAAAGWAVAVAAVLAGNVAVQQVRTARGAADDRAAAELVRTALVDGVPDAGGWRGLDLTVRRDAVPPLLCRGPEMHPRLRPDIGSRGGPCLVMAGWCLGRPSAAAGPVVRVVAVRGGEVVPADVRYFRQTGVERQAGYRVSATGFELTVPAGPGPAGDPPRLYAVAVRERVVVGEVRPPAVGK